MRLKPGLLRLSAGLLGIAADCQSIATGLPLVSPRAWPRKCAPREGGRRRAWRGEAGLLLQALSPGPGPTRADGQRVATERRSPPPGIPLYYSGHTGSISCHLEAPSQPPHSARANHDGGGKTAPGTPHWMVESPQRIVQIMCGVSVKLWVACFHRHIFVLACLWFLPIVLRRRELSPGLPRDRRKY